MHKVGINGAKTASFCNYFEFLSIFRDNFIYFCYCFFKPIVL